MIGRLNYLLKKLVIETLGVVIAQGGSLILENTGNGVSWFYNNTYGLIVGGKDLRGGQYVVLGGFTAAVNAESITPDEAGSPKAKIYGGEGSIPGAGTLDLASDTPIRWFNGDNAFSGSADLRGRRLSAGVWLVDDAAGGSAEVRAAKLGLAAGVFFTSYAGSPENNVAANKGAICSDTTNAKLYFKTTDTVATGWVEMARV